MNDILTIADLEKLLQRDDEIELEILPNGTIQQSTRTTAPAGDLKVLTMRESLGGEY